MPFIASIIAQMGMMLLSKKVVMSVAVITLEALKDHVVNAHAKDALQLFINTWKSNI